MSLTTRDVQALLDELRSDNSEVAEVEAKAGRTERLYESLSAMSNRPGGGVILLGVDESSGFAVCGVSDPARLQQDITSLAADAMEPPIRPEFAIVRIEGAQVLAVEVTECPVLRKPCYYKPAGLSQGSYIRVGASQPPYERL